MVRAKVLSYSLLIALLLPVTLAAQVNSKRADEARPMRFREVTVPADYSLKVSSKVVFDEQGEQLGYQQTMTVGSAKKVKVPVRPRNFLAPKTAFDKIALEPTILPLGGGEGNGGYGPRDACTLDGVVEVLGNELTYGAGGPHVPTRAGLSLDGAPEIPLFGGADVTTGMTDQFNMVEGQTLTVWGHMAYPNFEEPFPWVQGNYGSDDLVNAAILVNGSNYFQVAAQKGFQAPFGGQQALQDILGSRVNWNTGEVTLDPNKIVILYELGTTQTSSPAFDFNDLVLEITTTCPVPSEIVLRESATANTSWTNPTAHNPFLNQRITSNPGSYTITPVTIVAPQDLNLKEWRIIAGRTSLVGSIYDVDSFSLKVWNTMGEAIASPTVGTVYNLPVQPTSITVMSAVTFQGHPMYDVRFDLSALNISFPAGSSRFLVVDFFVNGGSDGGYGSMESDEPGPSDVQLGSGITGGWRYISSSANSFFDGRIALDLTATPE